VLAGTRAAIEKATRSRRMLGGALRQSGILAAAGLYALDHTLNRLSEDHAHARLMADRLATVRTVQLDLATVQTNIVIFRLAAGGPDAATVVARARDRGVLVSAFAARTVRVTTHLDVSRSDCARAADLLAAVIEA
jgi:threonine aldolase